MKHVTCLAAALCALGGSTALQAAYFTGSVGGAVPFDNMQPSLALNQLVVRNGNYPYGGESAANNNTAAIRTFAGYLRNGYGVTTASGQTLPIAQNTDLFSVVGTTYGGDGVRDFKLPDLGGRVIVGRSPVDLGLESGSNMVTLGLAQMPKHTHALPGTGDVTAPAGGAQPFVNRQASLSMTYMIATEGDHPAVASGDRGFLGQIQAFSGQLPPSGYMAANGQLLSIANYSALYNVFSTTYGGDGVTTFALPNLSGRAAVGAGGNGVTLGEAFGADSVAITTAQLALHNHDLPGGSATGAAGAGAPIDNYQASLGINYLIRTSDADYPSDDFTQATGPFLGEITAYAGGIIPTGWSLADGRTLAIRQNQALFSLLENLYGGDGTTTFRLPDLRGRSIIGTDDNYTLGGVYGSATIQLFEANLPAHAHFVPDAPVTPSVPEPASWAMMLIGFGVAGAALRRRGAAERLRRV